MKNWIQLTFQQNNIHKKAYFNMGQVSHIVPHIKGARLIHSIWDNLDDDYACTDVQETPAEIMTLLSLNHQGVAE